MLRDFQDSQVNTGIVATDKECKTLFLRLAGKTLKCPRTTPIPALFWAAGFSFSRSQLLIDVSYDPTLRHLFFGERTKSWRLGVHQLKQADPCSV